MRSTPLSGQPLQTKNNGLVSLVEISSGVPTTTSLAVAQKFGKRHDNVVRDIRKLASQLPVDYLPNFEEVISTFENGKGGTQQAPAFRITRDGFTLLAMGFTGKKALQFKLDYIDAFNRMERALLAQAAAHRGAEWRQIRQEGKQVRLAWGGCVQEFVAYARAQGSKHADKYYMAITKMEYAALELVKQASDKHFRDSLDCFQHGQLTVVEMAAQRSLQQGMDAGMHYKDIYQLCKAHCMQLAASLRKFLPANADSMRVSYVGAA